MRNKILKIFCVTDKVLNYHKKLPFIYAGVGVPAGPYIECRMVGDKYICPYCSNIVPHSQGITKGYTRHLGQVTCKNARKAAAKVASSSSNWTEKEQL